MHIAALNKCCCRLSEADICNQHSKPTVAYCTHSSHSHLLCLSQSHSQFDFIHAYKLLYGFVKKIRHLHNQNFLFILMPLAFLGETYYEETISSRHSRFLNADFDLSCINTRKKSFISVFWFLNFAYYNIYYRLVFIEVPYWKWGCFIYLSCLLKLIQDSLL